MSSSDLPVALSDASNRTNVLPAQPGTGGSKKNAKPKPVRKKNAKNATVPGLDDQSKADEPLTPSTNKDRKKTVASVIGKKRKANTTLEEDIAAYKQDLNSIISPDSFEDDKKSSCEVVRRRINELLYSGIMNRSEFAKAIGASPATLGGFLRAMGVMGGAKSSVYYNAWAWFKQRDRAKLRLADIQKRQKLEADAAAVAATTTAESKATATAGTSSGSSSGKPASSVKMIVSLPDITDIHLDGEETDEIPIYDSCDEIRKKINQHLNMPGVTQAQFCRDIYSQMKKPKCKAIQSKQLADFRALKGSRAGAKSSVFYAAYVYFEKIRIVQNKPKSAHRESMEERWAGEGGYSRTEDHRTSYLCSAGRSLYVDQYGTTTLGWS
ncbi:hypothetical protein GGS21DRAFT_139177 [Xylaria nigripes]|nr:hypothetical protein GGS21DRAFT_139177 [Xylaria nigripes]